MYQTMEALKDIGKQYYMDGNYEEAERVFTNILNKYGDSYEVLCNRSAVYIKLNDYDKALVDSAKSARLNPNSAKAWGRVGASLYGLKKLDQSIVAYRKAYELDDNIIYQNMINNIQKEINKSKFLDRTQYIIENSTGFNELVQTLMSDNNLMSKLMDPVFIQKVVQYETNPLQALKDKDLMETFSTMVNNDTLNKLFGDQLNNVKLEFEDIFKLRQ